jgi:hypothetical protein
MWTPALGRFGKMKILRFVFMFLGLLGVITTELILKHKIPENFELPLLLLFLGFIYIPFIVEILKNKEEIEIDFWNFRFILGLVSYPIILIGYIIYKIFNLIK